MGTELLGFGVGIRKGLIFTVRCCFRSVYNHPLLVGFLCFLILLHRSSPFVFSLLVSASPVLICTAVLLGVLLSYGETNIPEIEIEERKAKFEANGSYYVRRSGEKRGGGLDAAALPLIEEGREIESDSGEIREEGEIRGLSDLKLKNKWIDEKLNDEVLESDGEKSEAESFDSEKVNVASLDSTPRSPWTHLEEEEENEWAEDKQDDEKDSMSDQDESSSSDASMADIMPMLDEIHPLLDEETSLLQPVRGSHIGSDVASERSSNSGTDSRESDDVSEENHGDLEDDQFDDDDNEEGEDDAQGDKEEMTKSAITWTEEDQKNLMDLGSSEIERNQRLENLILRRRYRKNTSMVHEMNLIDLESIGYPSSLAPISTRRGNPFDDHHDSYDHNLGLPLIPGSAPSVMLQRRNPFDIPYDASEEKPDLMGDGFKEEFATSQSRGAVFRRHESFNVRPSVFAPDGNGARMRPYFVPEGIISEESSYASSFPRQSSELSESKLNYVSETESTGLVEDLNDRKLSYGYHQHEIEVNPQPGKIYEDRLGDPQLIFHQEDDEEEDINVGHGSESSEDEESVEVGRAELEIQLEDVVDHYQQGVNGLVEAQATDYHPNNECDEHVYRRVSSSSSLSEESERVFTEIESEGLSLLEERRDVVGILSQTSTEIINPSVSGALAIGIPQRAAIYDLSPRPDENNIVPETSTTHPMDVDIKEHGNVNIDFSEVEKEIDIKISDMSISFNSSVEASVVEEHELGKISGARDAENIHNIYKYLDVQFEVSEPLFEGRLIQLEEERGTVRSLDSEYDAYHRADEKLISTASVDGNANPFHDAGEIREPNFQHLDEVQALSALVDLQSSEDAQITHNSNMPEVQELHRDIPSKVNSPLSLEFISNTLNATEADDSHFNVQTAVEQVDDIKEIDKDILAELDSGRDFSVQQWGTGSTGFGKRFDSVEEDVVHSEALVENEITYTKTAYGMPELEAGKIEDIDVAFKEITTKDMVIDFEPVVKEPEHVNPSVAGPAHEVSVLEVGPIETPEIEVQHCENIDYFFNKSELAENEVTHQGHVDIETAYGMTELEASNVEDIDLAFKDITAKEVVVKENLVEHSKSESSSVTVSTPETIEEGTSSPPDSVDPALHANESEEARGISSGLDVAGKSVPSEETSLPPNGRVKVQTDEVNPSVAESMVQEINGVATEKPDNQVEVPKYSDSISYVKGKGSKGSSSSSSSS